MSHTRLRESLSEYLDGHLAPRRSARLERHLAHCSECRAELDALRELVRQLRDLGAVEAPPGLADRVMARVRAGEATPTWSTWLGDRVRRMAESAWWAPVPAAVVGVGMVIAVQNLQGRDGRSPLPAPSRTAASLAGPLPPAIRLADIPRQVATPMPTAPSLAVPRELAASTGTAWLAGPSGWRFEDLDLVGRWSSQDPIDDRADCLDNPMTALRRFPDAGPCLTSVAWETAAR